MAVLYWKPHNNEARYVCEYDEVELYKKLTKIVFFWRFVSTQYLFNFYKIFILIVYIDWATACQNQQFAYAKRKVQIVAKTKAQSQDPVVQSIVSLTISLRHKFVKQILAQVTNTLLFFVEKMWESFAVQRILTFFQQKIPVYL